jgi:hypothetical protein
VLQAKVAWPAHQQKNINSFWYAAVLVADRSENDFRVAAKKPINSRQGEESHLETAPFNEILCANPVAAEPRQHRHNAFTHALVLGDGSTGNESGTLFKPLQKNAPPDMQQTPTPQDGVFQSDNVLNEVEMELIWLGEESMYCL